MTEGDRPNVQLALDARAENVVLVREVLAGLAENVALGSALDDVKAAVSEACNNTIMHAYPGGEGPLEVDLRVLDGELRVVVRDSGTGTVRRAEDDETPARGIGLAVIEALASKLEIRATPGRGVEVEMGFEIPDAGLPAAGGEDKVPAVIADCGVRIAISPTELSGSILNRLISALAARAGFSIDRLSDAQMLGDTLGARVAAVLDGHRVSVGLDAADRALAMRIGPLRAGGAGSLVAAATVADLGSVVERLADEVGVSETPGGEVLAVVMRASPPGDAGS
ncbi:MAG TPA: ATP-binding protein [Solirubrobacteraceae bacterium]|jgi:serine/threonine-protein kinase RsbW|nr:ATP-binding protein [Solirubrobacteraceae bacterium]